MLVAIPGATGVDAGFGKADLTFGFWLGNCGLLIGWNRKDAGYS